MSWDCGEDTGVCRRRETSTLKGLGQSGALSITLLLQKSLISAQDLLPQLEKCENEAPSFIGQAATLSLSNCLFVRSRTRLTIYVGGTGESFWWHLFTKPVWINICQSCLLAWRTVEIEHCFLKWRQFPMLLWMLINWYGGHAVEQKFSIRC